MLARASRRIICTSLLPLMMACSSAPTDAHILPNVAHQYEASAHRPSITRPTSEKKMHSIYLLQENNLNAGIRACERSYRTIAGTSTFRRAIAANSIPQCTVLQLPPARCRKELAAYRRTRAVTLRNDYSVSYIAQLMGLHPRTVYRYTQRPRLGANY
jgi:hypothetical protein